MAKDSQNFDQNFCKFYFKSNKNNFKISIIIIMRANILKLCICELT